MVGMIPAASAAETVGGVTFGDMKTVTATRNIVLHMETDLRNPENIIFSDPVGLQIYSGCKPISLVGGTYAGYVEGVADTARFNGIYGFHQWDPNTIVVADYNNDCLRWVDRSSRRTTTFVGNCTHGGFRNGNNALFNGPFAVVRNVHSANKILVTEWYNNDIREVDIITGITSSLKSQVPGPRGLSYDLSQENLVISSAATQVEKYDMKNDLLSVLTGSKSKGFADGSLSSAKFGSLRYLEPLYKDITAVVDQDNQVIRVINEDTKSVSSICMPRKSGTVNGPPSKCKLHFPHSLLAKDGMLYIGQSSAIRAIPYSKITCPSDIPVFLGEGEQKAPVSWVNPSGGKYEAELSLGIHTFKMTLANNIDCTFKVNMKDSRLRKRLNIVARYDVACSEFQDNSVKSFVRSVAENMKKHIAEICDGECEVTDDHEIDLRCNNNTMTVVWPTNLVLPGTVNSLPDAMETKLTYKLKDTALLSLVMYNRIPPVIFPQPTRAGLSADLFLSEVCPAGQKYNPSTKQCM